MRSISTFGALAVVAAARLLWISGGVTRTDDVAPAAPEHGAARPTIEPSPATLARVAIAAAREEQTTEPSEATSEPEEYTEIRGSKYLEDFSWIGDQQGHPEDQPRLAPPSDAVIPLPHEAPLAVVDVAANTTFPPVVVPGSVLRIRLRPEEDAAGDSEKDSAESSARARPPSLDELTTSYVPTTAAEDLGDGRVLQWTRLPPGRFALSHHQPLLELDGRPPSEAVVFELPPSTTVERDVRYRWLR